jgi:hypothetical protein
MIARRLPHAGTRATPRYLGYPQVTASMAAAVLDARRRYRAIAQRAVAQPALHAAVGTGRTRLGPTTRRSTSRGAVGPGRPVGAAPAAELGRAGRRVAPR